MNIKTDIVLIDSGVNKKHKVLKEDIIEGCTAFLNEKENIDLKMNEFEDEEGHGTAVYSLLHRLCPDAAIYVIKIAYQKDGQISSVLLVKILQYILENIDCKIIHMSLGVEYCSHISEMQQICNKLKEKNILIVSAFSNLGCVSYPAAFSCVLGVDEIRECRHFDEFEYIENAIVNIRIAATAQLLPWGDGGIRKVAGTSFSSPYITALLYNKIRKEVCDFQIINSYLRDKAYRVRKIPIRTDEKKCFRINKAIVFPFNKEVHSIVRFNYNLSFELVNVYDCKFLGNVGKSTSSLLGEELVRDYVINDVEQINWEDDFDTIIIGHTKILEDITGVNYAKKLMQYAHIYKKKIYMFDDLALEGIGNKYNQVYIPKVDKEDVPNELLGKLYCVSTPILCVIGTSSKQGKFTLQNILKEKFESAGYRTGQLGTEPSAYLFGAAQVFPLGYNSTVKINGYDCVSVVNNMLHNIEENSPDIIITGTQSETVAISVACVENVPKEQSYFLYGVNADGYVLVCNYFDSIDYIERTIQHAESINGSKVIAVVLFPVDNDLRWSVLGSKKRITNEEQLMARKKEILNWVHKEVFILGIDKEMDMLFDTILKYYQ